VKLKMLKSLGSKATAMLGKAPTDIWVDKNESKGSQIVGTVKSSLDKLTYDFEATMSDGGQFATVECDRKLIYQLRSLQR